MTSPGFYLIISSTFSRTFSLYDLESSQFLLCRLHYHTMGSSIKAIFLFLLNGSKWVSLFCFKLELGLKFPLSVSKFSSSSVTVLFTELVLLLVSFFYFRRKFMIASFTISSFSKMDMRLLKLSNSTGEFLLLL